MPVYIKPFSLFTIFVVLIFGGVVFCDVHNKVGRFFLGVVGILRRMWYLGPIVSQYPVEKILWGSHEAFKLVDQG